MALTEDMAFNLIEGAHARSRLAHAFLISGAAGSGKRDLAARVVALVNPVETGEGSDLFGESPESSSSVDLDDLEGEFVRVVRPRSRSRRILIDDIRGLERSMHLAAPSGIWKIGVVVDADRMFDEPANAFLKTLEEPPPGCLLLLLTSNADILLPTLRLVALRSDCNREVKMDFSKRRRVRPLPQFWLTVRLSPQRTVRCFLRPPLSPC